MQRVVIVSGFHAEVVEGEAMALGLKTVRNPAAQQGMFSSVRAGVAALTQSGFDGYFFVQPVDIPLVRPLPCGLCVKRQSREKLAAQPALQ